MSNHSFKKFLAAGTSAAVVVAAVTPAAFAHENHKFADVTKNYEEAVTFLHDWEIVNGKTETTFGTNLNLTRGDAAVIMANALGLDIENAPSAGFTDLNSRIAGSVNALAEVGIISGVTKEKFAPNDPLTRGAMAKILVLSFELDEFAVDTPFIDAVGVFGPYIEALYGTEITYGKTETTFGTNLNITRGDFANLLYRTFTFLEDTIYIPYAQTAELVDSNTITVTLEEAAPAEYSAEEVAEGLWIMAEFADRSVTVPAINNAVISDDLTVLTFDIAPDLAGKEGLLYIDELEIEFNFTAGTTNASALNFDAASTVGSEQINPVKITTASSNQQ